MNTTALRGINDALWALMPGCFRDDPTYPSCAGMPYLVTSAENEEHLREKRAAELLLEARDFLEGRRLITR